ncbi:MAG: hypothetical protein QNK03_15145 [Myxococcota bacterium]|nr:hypothetical protein [Myxococcota bacterium]
MSVAARAPAAPAAWAAAAVAALFALALALRLSGLDRVFVGDDVVLALGDAAYHARLAAYSYAHFPEFLAWDPYLNGPFGGPVPWPPAFDWIVALAALGTGAGPDGVERVLALSTPLLGALGVIPVYLAARRLAGRGVSLGAAALFAGLGIAIHSSRVGNGDHHALVGTLGACLLAASLAFVTPRAPGARIWPAALAVALARTAVLISWNGSLLYVVLAEGTLLSALVGSGWGRHLRGYAAGLALTGALVAPMRLAFSPPCGGPWSAIALSNLHLLALALACTTALVMLGWERVRPASGAGARLARLAGTGLVLAALPLLWPSLRRGLGVGLGFVALQDLAGAATYEQMPLVPIGTRRPAIPAVRLFGHLVWALPLLPFVALAAARDPSRRLPALVLAGWLAPLVVLTVSQVRYGNDLAAPGSIALALGIGRAAWTATPLVGRRLAAALAVSLVLALQVPPLWTMLRSLSAVPGHLRGALPEARLVSSPLGSLMAFAREVARVTPATGDFLDPAAEPPYAVAANANLGHTLRYYAQRPVPADGFWAWLDAENFSRATALLETTDEAESVAIADRVRARFVVTAAGPGGAPRTLASRLQRDDGNATAELPRLERFRLITEGPRGGRPLTDLRGLRRPRRVVPYKLFEVVPGALLEVEAEVPVEASITLVTPLGRRFSYRARAAPDADGVARLRVPYASQTEAPVRAAGPWKIRVGEREWSAAVSDAQVLSGAVIRTRPDAA